MVGRALVVIGLLILGVGALVWLGFPLGRLPGDLVYRRGSMTVYVPIVTSIILSVMLTLVVSLIRR
tara:strand:- start:1455 stop:1652 length:198 start_codon:yes stop_codon:yes gene_type:complete